MTCCRPPSRSRLRLLRGRRAHVLRPCRTDLQQRGARNPTTSLPEMRLALRDFSTRNCGSSASDRARGTKPVSLLGRPRAHANAARPQRHVSALGYCPAWESTSSSRSRVGSSACLIRQEASATQRATSTGSCRCARISRCSIGLTYRARGVRAVRDGRDRREGRRAPRQRKGRSRTTRLLRLRHSRRTVARSQAQFFALAGTDSADGGMSVRFVRQDRSHAEAWRQSWPGCRIDASAFVEKVSGSRPGCP